MFGPLHVLQVMSFALTATTLIGGFDTVYRYMLQEPQLRCLLDSLYIFIGHFDIMVEVRRLVSSRNSGRNRRRQWYGLLVGLSPVIEKTFMGCDLTFSALHANTISFS